MKCVDYPMIQRHNEEHVEDRELTLVFSCISFLNVFDERIDF